MKRNFVYIILIFLLTGCSEEITTDDLIGGHWIGTAGYEDENIEGEPYCYPFHDGMKFIDKDSVYVDEYEKEFEYWLEEDQDGIIIEFYDPDTYLRSYHITLLSENNIGLIGEGNLLGDQSCYLERK